MRVDPAKCGIGGFSHTVVLLRPSPGKNSRFFLTLSDLAALSTGIF